tara:strand:- start:75 stop:1217 length:1143 start_codon:yes stop_codon:yes gene_type:complete
MKNIAAIIFTLLVLIACSKEKTETVKMGSKDSNLLEIKNFSESAKPKNIILAIADGSGLNHITVSRLAIGGQDYKLYIDQLPVAGISSTHAYENLITDSAAAATAWATGNKTKNRYLSVDKDKKELTTIFEMLDDKGYLKGIVATSSVTHATPAAFYAHIDSRYKEKEIAAQLLNSSVDIALGGGQEFFNLEEVEKNHYLMTQKASLEKNYGGLKNIVGLFDEDGMERGPDMPTQREMTNFALDYLDDKCNGFFLMTEGSQIDWAGHSNDIEYMIREFKDFDLTIKDLINFVSANKNTLLIITADHETGGLQLMKQKDNSFIVQWGTGSHTGVPVGVYAYGPGSQNFNGMMDNTDIFYKILEVLDYQNLTNSTCGENNDR